MIIGLVEVLSPDFISGWALDTSNPDRKLKIRASISGDVIASTECETERLDVGKHYEVEGGNFGFLLSGLPAGCDLDGVMVEAGWRNQWTRLSKIAVPARYQSFDGDGASNSSAKLEALRLTELPHEVGSLPLQGKSVLDIGCNEGFFCREAVRQGAVRVVGIDRSPHFIAAARQNVPEADFHLRSWWDMDYEQFDVIFFLSAIHYEDRQRDLLQMLSTRLKPNGTLILECGVWPQTFTQSWQIINRGDGPKRYPTRTMLEGTLLADYAPRYIGRSVMQAGDPVQRDVYHCRKRLPTVMLIHGESNVGKSCLAKSLQSAANIYSIDLLLNKLFNHEMYAGLPLREAIVGELKGFSLNDAIDMLQMVKGLGMIDSFCDMVVDELPLEGSLTVAEGQALSDPEIRNKIVEKLENRGVICWETVRSM